ncbi:muconolactone Delta-isomerase family protein [Paraburkholderia sp. DHOC27]|uniref:muconolactone Delta-isomerase family protein n=1 Tax=Paraburkholderia sp. DHOC27 TaxID=2303330 RepID=UPI000E3C2313|nr:muconolactone Delta-isomerase family protein [Paraburkholderia sp. DHOC27]RFU45467.1 hypothetical protein D0B32_22925 [Paraburkholderia sp. DHOC27]
MQFMVSINLNPEKAKAAPSKDLAEAEAQVVRGFYMDGLVRQIWVRADGSGAIILAEAESAEIAAKQLAELPLVREGILLAPEVVALAPYFGFAPRA